MGLLSPTSSSNPFTKAWCGLRIRVRKGLLPRVLEKMVGFALLEQQSKGNLCCTIFIVRVGISLVHVRCDQLIWWSFPNVYNGRIMPHYWDWVYYFLTEGFNMKAKTEYHECYVIPPCNFTSMLTMHSLHSLQLGKGKC